MIPLTESSHPFRKGEDVRTVLKIAMSILLVAAVIFNGDASSTAYAQHPLEPSDTSSPRATLNSFLEACNDLYDLSKVEKLTKEASPEAVSALERVRHERVSFEVVLVFCISQFR